MMTKRRQLFFFLILMTFWLGGCDQIEDLTQEADVSQIEKVQEAEFYNQLQTTVAEVQFAVIGLAMVNLMSGWKLGRLGLAINGAAIGGLMIYTYLMNNADLVKDENTRLGLTIAGGIGASILAFYLYNLMAVIIGGVIGTTLMGGTWLKVAQDVPPQVLVFASTFISAMVMFVVFRLFMVAFSAVIGATLLMLALPTMEPAWVLPIAGLGMLVQSGIAWWINDDIFKNLRGDLRTATKSAFGEVLAPVLDPIGMLRERQSGQLPNPAQAMQQASAKMPPSAAPYGGMPPHPQTAPPPYHPQGQPYVAPPPYGQPQQPPYNQPQTPPAYHPYGQPQQPPHYNQPQQPPYIPPAAPAYNNPPPPVAPPPYNQPQQPPYVAPAAPVYNPQPAGQPAAQPPARPEGFVAPLNRDGSLKITPELYTTPPASNPLEQTQPSLVKFRLEDYQIELSDGRVFPLQGTQITVGRSVENVIVVNDPQVSSSHLVFYLQAEGVMVADNNSTNGTLFNGTPLKSVQRLTPADSVKIGEVTLRLVRRMA